MVPRRAKADTNIILYHFLFIPLWLYLSLSLQLGWEPASSIHTIVFTSHSDAVAGTGPHVFFKMHSGIQTPTLMLLYQALKHWPLSPFIPSLDFLSVLLEISSFLFQYS